MHETLVNNTEIIKESHIYMLENTIAPIKSTFGTKLGFFLFGSPLLRAGSSFWPKCSGTITLPLVALLAAVLLRRVN